MEPNCNVSSCRQSTCKSRELLQGAQVSQMKQSDNPCQSSGTLEKVPFLCYPRCYAKLHFWLINLFLIHGDLMKTCIGFFICSFEFNGGMIFCPSPSFSTPLVVHSSFGRCQNFLNFLFRAFIYSESVQMSIFHVICVYIAANISRDHIGQCFQVYLDFNFLSRGKNQPSSPM